MQRASIAEARPPTGSTLILERYIWIYIEQGSFHLCCDIDKQETVAVFPAARIHILFYPPVLRLVSRCLARASPIPGALTAGVGFQQTGKADAALNAE